MRKLDLNIKLQKTARDEAIIRLKAEVNALLKVSGKTEKYNLEEDELNPVDVAKNWLDLMLSRAINKPDNMGRATHTVGMDVQRRCFKVMSKVDEAKDGIIEMEDEDFDFLDRKFHQAEISYQKEVSSVLVQLDNAFNKAKVEK